MEGLLHFDESLFRLINGQWHTDCLDWIMPYWRSKYFWMPVYVFLAAFLFVNFGKKTWPFILFAVLAIGISDFVSSQLIKNSVERLRPCNDPELQGDVLLLVPCGGGYSFTSSHAANHFAISVFLILTLGRAFRWLWPLLFFWAVSVGFAQVYVGLHYPLDVLCGGMLGTAVAIVSVLIYYSFGDHAIDFKATQL